MCVRTNIYVYVCMVWFLTPGNTDTYTHTHTYEEEQGVRAGEEVYGVGYIYMMKGFVHPKEDSSLFALKFTQSINSHQTNHTSPRVG